jgi:hypothetical protein
MGVRELLAKGVPGRDVIAIEKSPKNAEIGVPGTMLSLFFGNLRALRMMPIHRSQIFQAELTTHLFRGDKPRRGLPAGESD